MATLNKLHWHVCYSCADQLTCCCADRRQNDRITGKERRIYCEFCLSLKEQLEQFYGKPTVRLERAQ